MMDNKTTRLSKVAREFNVGTHTIVDFLRSKGIEVNSNPNTKIEPDVYVVIAKEYGTQVNLKTESQKLNLDQSKEKKETVSLKDIQDKDKYAETGEDEKTEKTKDDEELKPREKKAEPKILGKIDLDSLNEKPKEKEEPESEEKITDKKEKSGDIKHEEDDDTSPVSKETTVDEPEKDKDVTAEKEAGDKHDFKVVGKINLDLLNQKTRPTKKTKEEKESERLAKRKGGRKAGSTAGDSQEKETDAKGKARKKESSKEEKKTPDHIETSQEKLAGPNVIGQINLSSEISEKRTKEQEGKTRKRKRIKKDSTSKVDVKQGGFHDRGKTGDARQKKGRRGRPEVNEQDVEQQIKDTLAKLTQKGKTKGSKYRRERRAEQKAELEEIQQKKKDEKSVLKLTEFVSVSDLANMMDIPPTDIIAACMSLGLFVSINQRLDAETISIVADEFGFQVEFTSVEMQESIEYEEDKPEDLKPRAPIVTVMGHVDHGKTKLLDFVRHANVIDGEAGGITQHIGAYSVLLGDGKKITFLDTPGHEAFTAMRARGAQVTDIAIIMVAADDGVMPQTVEAINHASAAGVPLVFAINKIDKPDANVERVKEQLSNMNYLLEDWGGKYQSQEISAKNGINIELLLEKVLLEAELLELKANPDKMALGTVVESSLDRGRGYVSTILIQSGTLKMGDILLAGSHHGRVRAMYNERNQKIMEAGPSTPVLVLGLDGAPQAGDKFNVLDNEKEVREIANKRLQLQREQGLRAQKHITLDEIGRRIAVGNFQELNVIVKGDVDGSVEALADSIAKLSNDEIQINIVHKAVGQISESDVLLAAASNAVIVGFQVRPSLAAKKLAEKEEIDIRLYSIIYDVIDELKAAMEGMLSPEIKEEITATIEIMEIFKITKVGTVAGCIVRDGKINRDNKIRLIRDGIVMYSGDLGSLKRFKDDVKEVVSGQECGLNIVNYNDIKVGDFIESYREVEIRKTLK